MQLDFEYRVNVMGTFQLCGLMAVRELVFL